MRYKLTASSSTREKKKKKTSWTQIPKTESTPGPHTCAYLTERYITGHTLLWDDVPQPPVQTSALARYFN